ncbi:hematopoietic prostaglandin D synthase-like isoform X3 [Patiria miniata]|uniref:Glutathione S-transferase n=1 Tax=Patiria miniata TaxID=46514 RepID=A0A914ABY6_PATMI|nr:hematopoietic prostaglandin D synthase-like isoform X3 [Patiria miniata]
MVKYVLHYFKAQGRAESIRLAFKLAGVDYDEKSFEFADWPKLKPTFPTQQTPSLEVDGKMICQSKAILRYLAREFGFYGKTSLDAAFIDQAIDAVEDIWTAGDIIFHGPAESRPEKIEKFLKDVVPPIYATLERLIGQKQAGDFFVGNSITAADLFFFTAVDMVNVLSKGANSVEKYPKLVALKSRIAANPKIAAWLAVRPPEATL